MNNRKKLYISIGVILSVMALVTIFAFRQEAQTNNSNKPNQQEQDDPPTPIQLGVMNEKQKKNSKKYNDNEKVNEKLVGEKRSLIRVTGRTFSEDFPLDRLIPQRTFFEKITCQSEVVVIGKVLSKNSQFSDDATTIFTDYEFEILEVLKSHVVNLNPGMVITTSRHGGRVLFNNYVIEVRDRGLKNLKVSGNYLLFLNYLPDSESFVPRSSESTYRIQGNRFMKNSDSKNTLFQKEDDQLINLTTFIRGVSPRCHK